MEQGILNGNFHVTEKDEPLKELVKEFYVDRQTNKELQEEQIQIAIKQLQEINPEITEIVPSGTFIYIPPINLFDFGRILSYEPESIPPLESKKKEPTGNWWDPTKTVKKKIDGAKPKKGDHDEGKGEFVYEPGSFDLKGHGLYGVSCDSKAWIEIWRGPETERPPARQEGYFTWAEATGEIRSKTYKLSAGKAGEYGFESQMVEKFTIYKAKRMKVTISELQQEILVVEEKCFPPPTTKTYRRCNSALGWVDVRFEYRKGEVVETWDIWSPNPQHAIDAADALDKSSSDIRRYRDSIPGAESSPAAEDPFKSK